MTSCEICGAACLGEPVPDKPCTIRACRSHGFTFYITLQGKHELNSVREYEEAEVVQRTIDRIVCCGNEECAAGRRLLIDSRLVRIMADRPVDD